MVHSDEPMRGQMPEFGAAASAALKEAANSTNRSIVRTSIVLAALAAVVWFAPTVITGAGSPCGALAVATASSFADAHGIPTASKFDIGMAQVVGGAVVEARLAEQLPNVPPQLSCLVAFWIGRFFH